MKQRMGQKSRKIAAVAVCAFLGLSAQLSLCAGDSPRLLPGLRKSANSQAQQQSEISQNSSQEQLCPNQQYLLKNWSLICWYNPVQLLEELKEVRQTSELKAWSESTEELISLLSYTFPEAEAIPAAKPQRVGNGKIIRAIREKSDRHTPLFQWDFEDESIVSARQNLLGQLSQKVQEAQVLQQQADDLNALTALVRANYTLQRRLVLWTYCSHLMSLPPQDKMSSISESEWNQTVSEVEQLLQGQRNSASWCAYLRVNALKNFLKADPSLRRNAAWQILARLNSKRLMPAYQEFFGQKSFLELTELLVFCGAERTSNDCLMRDVEMYESGQDVKAGERIRMESQRLAMEHGELAGEKAKSLELMYRNANLRLWVSQEFLNSSIPQPGSEERTIQENILNRQVYGRGISESSLSVRMVPDSQNFRLGFLVNGTMTSSTYSPDVVTVFNRSDAQFAAFKEIVLHEQGISFKPAVADASNQTQLRDLQTPLDPIPLIGFVANGVARNQAQSKQAAINHLTEDRIRNEVCERLDQQANEKLTEANLLFQQKILAPMNRLELDLEKIDAQTYTDSAAIRFRVAGSLQPGAFTPRPIPPNESLVNFQVHESLANNFLQHLQLEGKTFTIETLGTHLERFFPNLKLGERMQNPKEELSFTFADSNALTVRIHEGQFLVRLGLKELQADGKRWKNFAIEVPYLLETDEKAVFIQRASAVRLIGRIPFGQQIAVRGIFSKVFPKTEKKNILPEMFTKNPRFESLVLNQLVLQDGWLGVSFAEPLPDVAFQGLSANSRVSAPSAVR